MVTVCFCSTASMTRLRHAPTTLAGLHAELERCGIHLLRELKASLTAWARMKEDNLSLLNSRLVPLVVFPIQEGAAGQPMTCELSPRQIQQDASGSCLACCSNTRRGLAQERPFQWPSVSAKPRKQARLGSSPRKFISRSTETSPPASPGTNQIDGESFWSGRDRSVHGSQSTSRAKELCPGRVSIRITKCRMILPAMRCWRATPERPKRWRWCGKSGTSRRVPQRSALRCNLLFGVQIWL